MFGLPPPPRLGLFGARSAPTKPHPLLLKARKNFDLSTDCIPLLSSKKHKGLNGRTIKQLLSQYIKKKPFAQMALDLKSCAFSKVVARNVKSFSCSGSQRPDRKFLNGIIYSYKHLEQLDVKDIGMKNQSSLASIAKLNHLQSLSMELATNHYLPSRRFFQSLKHLRHITFSIAEGTKNMEPNLVELTGFLYNFTLLPSLESYNIEICSASSSESFVGTVLYYLTLLKAKRSSVRLRCPENIDLKVEMFSSFLENIDTLEYKYSDRPQKIDFQAPNSKKLFLFLHPSQSQQSLAYIVNACTSLQNLSVDATSQLTAFKLPQTLKTLKLNISNPQSSETLKFCENMLSSLDNLENLNLLLFNPNIICEEWVSQLPRRVSFKSLKQYHLELDCDPMGPQFEYHSFLVQWSKGVQSLFNLEGLSLEASSIKLKSLDFFTEMMGSLSKLKTVKLKLHLSHEQPKETLKFAIPSQNLPSLEHIWLSTMQYASKDSATQLLHDLRNCENLQNLAVCGLTFDEQEAVSTLKKLTSLKTVEIGTYKALTSDEEDAISALKGFTRMRARDIATSTKLILRLNSKKEFILCKKQKFFEKFF